MTRLPASILFCGVMAGTLALKVQAGDPTGSAGGDGDPEAIVRTLRSHAFTVGPIDWNGSPVWIVGDRSGCRLKVADVSPQGWHRAIVAQQAAGSELRYAFAGRTFEAQPVGMTSFDHYWRRLKRSFGFEAPSPSVRAIAWSPACIEAGLPIGELSAPS